MTDALLAIDVDAELAKLGLGALDGPHQVAAEVVRLALRRGATRVTVDIGARRLRVAGDFAPLPPEAEAHLLRLLDPGAPAMERHACLLALERAGLGALLGLAALAPTHLALGDGALDLHHAPLDAARARGFLRAVARFAPAELALDGRVLETAVGGAFAGAGACRPLAAPLVGHVAWTGRRGGARVWLLAGGLLSGHLNLPDAPAFEAVLETDGLCAPDAAPEARRAAVLPRLPALVEQAVALLVAAAAELPGREIAWQRHVRAELLAAARARRDISAVLRAPAWPAWVVPPGDEIFTSLFDLGRTAGETQPARALPVVDPRVDPLELLPSGRPVWRLDADEIGALGELLGVRFESAPRRRPASAWSRARRRLAGWLAEARDLVSPRGAPLSEGELAPEEIALRAALQRELRTGAAGPQAEVRLRRGDGAPRVARRGGRFRLDLAREHAAVRAAARAVQADPRWAWAAALALLHAAGWRPR